MPELQIDGIKIATISTELAARLRLALDQPHAWVTQVDAEDARRVEGSVATPDSAVLSASVHRASVAVCIETSSGLVLTDVSGKH